MSFIFPLLAHSPDDHPWWQRGGQIFETVHNQINSPIFQRLLQLLRKQVFLSDLKYKNRNIMLTAFTWDYVNVLTG